MIWKATFMRMLEHDCSWLLVLMPGPWHIHSCRPKASPFRATQRNKDDGKWSCSRSIMGIQDAFIIQGRGMGWGRWGCLKIRNNSQCACLYISVTSKQWSWVKSAGILNSFLLGIFFPYHYWYQNRQGQSTFPLPWNNQWSELVKDLGYEGGGVRIEKPGLSEELNHVYVCSFWNRLSLCVPG